MPFNTLTRDDFLNRGYELNYLKSLPKLKNSALGGNVFLEGAGGIGKTEMLKQLHRSFFHEDEIAPFYYSFRTANSKGAYFAKDYFTRFIKQYISFLKKESAFANSVAEPLHRLFPTISSLGLPWLSDCIEDFQDHVSKNDIYWQIMAAISAPAIVAEKSGKTVIVLLDDFDASEHLYESTVGDAHGLTSLFGESMRHSRCPYIITGAVGVLENIFTDHSLIGMTERMRLGPLPKDMATALFRSHIEKLGINCIPAAQLKFLSLLRGNPLYIRNIVKAAWKIQKKDIDENDLRECYCFDISEGETSFYWYSTLCRFVNNDTGLLKTVLTVLMHFIENGAIGDSKRLAKVLGLCETETVAALGAINGSGIIRYEDEVSRDFIRCRYMEEIEGRTSDYAREKIVARHVVAEEESCFEMTIPMDENAELVVAKAVEQIGKNIHLDDEFLNFLQLALIEVCINAIEHSGSYEKKVYLKFITRPDRLKIIIENSGKPFSLDSLTDVPVEEKLRTGMKRGWGYKLVREIMDDVKVERIKDRTRVTMTKEIHGGIDDPEIWTEL